MQIVIALLIALVGAFFVGKFVEKPFGAALDEERKSRSAEKARIKEEKEKENPGLTERLTKALNDVLPISFADATEMQLKIDRAGFKMSAGTWRTTVLVFVIAAVILVSLLMSFLGNQIFISILIGLIAGMVTWALSGLWLRQAAKKRSETINAKLPSALDILTISVAAGALLERGFRQVADDKSFGPLAEEFARVDTEISKLGFSRTQALKNLETRCGSALVSYFTTALIDASEKGASIVNVLESQSRLATKIRADELETEAKKLSTKMTIPMVCFFMPSILILALAPQVGVVMEFVGTMTGAM